MTAAPVSEAVLSALRSADGALRQSHAAPSERALLVLGLLYLKQQANWQKSAGGGPWGQSGFAGERQLSDVFKSMRNAEAEFAEVYSALEEAAVRLERGGDRRAAHSAADAFQRLVSGDPEGTAAAVDAFLDGVMESDNRGDRGTPSDVAELMVRVADPGAGHEILDPCCGSGGLLTRAFDHVRAGDRDGEPVHLHGQEADFGSYCLARLNLRVHGLDDDGIRFGDALVEPAFVDRGGLARFDRVITAPPFSARWRPRYHDPYERFVFGEPAAHSADFAFLQHAAASLRHDARAVVMVPPGVLFRGGKEGQIRKGMVEADLLDAVIGLPRKVLPGTGIAPVVLVLRTGKPVTRVGKILFVDASHGVEERRTRTRLAADVVERAVHQYAVFEPGDETAKLVDFNELREAGFDLNLSRWLAREETPEPVDVARELAEIHALEAELQAASVAADELIARFLERMIPQDDR